MYIRAVSISDGKIHSCTKINHPSYHTINRVIDSPCVKIYTNIKNRPISPENHISYKHNALSISLYVCTKSCVYQS